MLFRKITATALLCAMVLSCFTAYAAAADSTYYNKYAMDSYTVSHRVTVKNHNGTNIYNIKVTVPLMSTDQPDYQELLGEALFPYPESIEYLPSGERRATYIIPVLKPGETVVFEQRYFLNNWAIRYQIDAEKVVTEYDGKVDEKYLLPEPGIESDNSEIIAYARKFGATDSNPYSLARKFFRDINLYLDYGSNGATGETSNGSAVAALKSGRGICTDYTALFVAIMRALGIPARQRTGYLYQTELYNDPTYYNSDNSLNLYYMPHTWAEFYLSGVGWITVDPTFNYMVDINGKAIKMIDWEYFAAINPSQRHVFFTDGASIENISYTYSPGGGVPEITFDARLYSGSRIVPFNDAISHWAANDILFLYDYRDPPIIRGLSDGIYGVNNPVTRAELAVVLYRMLEETAYGQNDFNDVSDTYWAALEIRAIVDSGLMVGYPDGRFCPDNAVTRAEMAVIMTRFLALPATAGEIKTPFTDLDTPGSEYAKDSILLLARHGLVGGIAEGIFAPGNNLTRAEMATMLTRIIKHDLLPTI